MRIERFLDELGRDAIQQALGEASPALVRATTDKRHGDYQLNGAMPLAKKHKRPPRELGQAIAAELVRHPAVAGADVAGPGFVNLRLADAWLAERLVEQAADHDRDGVPPVDAPTRVLIDFSSPNIAKQMHVGHIRSTIIGDALQRLLRYVGHDVKSDNHLGDWGTQFGLLIVGMREWGSPAELERSPIVELERVYKLAAARAKQDEAFAAAARAELAKLQAGDAENRRLWQQFVSASKPTPSRA